MASSPAKVTVSAGGIVHNGQGHFLLVSQNGNSWSFPKGHVEIGEEPLHAAIREINEESGVTDLQYVKPLGSYGRYKIGKNAQDDTSEWKVMVFFLFTTKQNLLKPLDPRHPEARWVEAGSVETFLTHPKDKAFFKTALSQL